MTSTLIHFLYNIAINSQFMLPVMSITVDITIDLLDIPLFISLTQKKKYNLKVYLHVQKTIKIIKNLITRLEV